MRPDDSKFATVPVGKLGIIVHPSCAELGKRIDQYIVNWSILFPSSAQLKRMLYLKITSRILILSMQPVPVSEPVKQRHSSPILFVA